VYQLLGLAQRAGKVVSGANSIKSVAKNKSKLKCVLIASDVSENSRRKIHSICRAGNIPLYELDSRDEIGRAIGKGQRTVVGITDAGFYEAIKQTIGEERSKVNDVKTNEFGGGIND